MMKIIIIFIIIPVITISFSIGFHKAHLQSSFEEVTHTHNDNGFYLSSDFHDRQATLSTINTFCRLCEKD